jgi:ABC-type polysaccharide/polyol phosphate transport system ATPase subunit
MRPLLEVAAVRGTALRLQSPHAFRYASHLLHVRGRPVHPPNRRVLGDISLGFYYGAKIGVLGLNGPGKSTLLRIIAGVDTGYGGELAVGWERLK